MHEEWKYSFSCFGNNFLGPNILELLGLEHTIFVPSGTAAVAMGLEKKIRDTFVFSS